MGDLRSEDNGQAVQASGDLPPYKPDMITPESVNAVLSLLHIPPDQRLVTDILRAAVVHALAGLVDLRLRVERLERACGPLLMLEKMRGAEAKDVRDG